MMIKYVLKANKQVDWAYKTTYVQLDVVTDIDTKSRLYYKNGINEFIGYFNDVKPYHTKIRNLFAKTKIDETAVVDINEDRQFAITVNFETFDSDFVGTDDVWVSATSYAVGARVLYKNSIYSCVTANSDVNFNASNWLKIQSVVSSAFTDTTVDLDYESNSFTGSATNVVELDGGTFIQPNLYNYTGETNRRNIFDVEATEHLNIVVQTNPIDSSDAAGTRTFVYVHNNNNKVKVFALEGANETTLSADASLSATTIDVTDGTKFNSDGGYAWANGEIIKYNQVIGNQLLHIERDSNNAKAHTSGDVIVDVTDNELYDTAHTNVLLNEIYNNSGNYQFRGLTHAGNTEYFPTTLQNGTKGIVL